VGLIITILAVAVRLVWVLKVPTRPVGDFAMYLESARYLVDQGTLDPEFIYMPGYVLAAAGVYALGGGLLAVKMIGVASGGLATAAVYGTAGVLFGRPAAIAAGLACALWPAGIAVSSVTGTDMPAAALLATAVWLLVRTSGERPLGAPLLYGLALGLTAYVRAIALPLAALAVFHFRAQGARWFHAFTRTGLACLVAFLVLLPWGLRNHHRYGEFFITDSHGGHTALVGANPNSDGVYSRSLNRMFSEGTGHRLFVEPHRASDRVAYQVAKQWTAYDPKFALGLLAAKADRLLTYERPLLYWPIYRQSVLVAGSPVEAWLARHRTGIERLCDGYWYLLVAVTLIGLCAAAVRRNGPALSLLPLPLVLIALYTAFFAEVRYHLAIVVLLLPFAGAGLVWVGELVRDLARRVLVRHRRPRLPLEAGLAGALILLVFVGWPRLVAGGARLRDHHRWAAFVCSVDGARRLCAARDAGPAAGTAPSPVRGVWDGFVLQLTSPAAAATAIDLPAGRYQISLRVERAEEPGASPTGGEGSVSLWADGAERAQAALPLPGDGTTLAGIVPHAGGDLTIEVRALGAISGQKSAGIPDGGRLLISTIAVETDRP
jgi:4-amino-4-deoxy-L-arabinose transferase-like glycosyltransferase